SANPNWSPGSLTWEACSWVSHDPPDRPPNDPCSMATAPAADLPATVRPGRPTARSSRSSLSTSPAARAVPKPSPAPGACDTAEEVYALPAVSPVGDPG